MNNIYTSTLSISTPLHEYIRYTLFHKNCCLLKCKLSRHKKDTTTYFTISNDVLIFTISRLTICRNSVVKYKYQPSKSLENALFSAFYLSRLFIVGTDLGFLYTPFHPAPLHSALIHPAFTDSLHPVPW